MMKIDNKEKITELVGNIGKDNDLVSFDKDLLEKTREKDTILYGSYLSAPSEGTSPMQSILNQLKESIDAKVDDFQEYDLCSISILCHNADELKMDDLAKLQMFLSEYINPEAKVTWEYGVDESLKSNQMRLTLILG